MRGIYHFPRPCPSPVLIGTGDCSHWHITRRVSPPALPETERRSSPHGPVFFLPLTPGPDQPLFSATQGWPSLLLPHAGCFSPGPLEPRAGPSMPSATQYTWFIVSPSTRDVTGPRAERKECGIGAEAGARLGLRSSNLDSAPPWSAGSTPIHLNGPSHATLKAAQQATLAPRKHQDLIARENPHHR